jgi:type II secretory pathway predicted ATPase ExeA
MKDSLYKTFGFRKLPFTREIYEGEMYMPDNSSNNLFYVGECLNNKLSCAVIAPPGMGKTAFLRQVCKRLPENGFSFSYVKSAGLGRLDMYKEICNSLGISARGIAPSLRVKIEDHLNGLRVKQNITPVIIFDDAHEIRPEAIMILRLLTNFEMDSKLLVSFILCGHPSLRKLLRQTNLEDVAQRISHVVTIAPLSEDESMKYITHRCSIAGVPQPPFESFALQAIWQKTNGNMRAMDDLCLKTMEVAAQDGKNICNRNHVIAAGDFLL